MCPDIKLLLNLHAHLGQYWVKLGHMFEKCISYTSLLRTVNIIEFTRVCRVINGYRVNSKPQFILDTSMSGFFYCGKQLKALLDEGTFSGIYVVSSSIALLSYLHSIHCSQINFLWTDDSTFHLTFRPIYI